MTITPYTHNTNTQALAQHLLVSEKEVNGTVLRLMSKQLSSLPPEIGALTRVTRLFLNGNNLTTLPHEIGNLVNLEMLYLNHNQLTSVPESIGKLVKLNILALNNNYLSSLPSGISILAQLEKLLISDNEFTNVPEDLFGLSKKCLIHIKNNPINKSIINILKERVNSSGYTGPRFDFTLTVFPRIK